ncbi:hypothetical protein KUTeg_018064 [Tegillarca granosa]|uniref:Uncharacterized protein n=1 Tax=Tegillarca granosa TaxID=220873 RepID=A0ABQ9EKS6_TEGGR|nr:hypothetical protein KUTeg_018064 [Tegillarca granosa]
MSNSRPGIRDYKIVILGDGGVGKSGKNFGYAVCVSQPEFNAMHEQYMRNGEGYILCYSITDKRSFDAVVTYKKLIDRVRCRDDIPIVLAANKCDLEEKRMVTTEEGMAVARQLGCAFYETSSVLRQCVDDVFYGLVQDIRRRERESLEDVDKTRKGKKKGVLNRLLKGINKLVTISDYKIFVAFSLTYKYFMICFDCVHVRKISEYDTSVIFRLQFYLMLFKHSISLFCRVLIRNIWVV